MVGQTLQYRFDAVEVRPAAFVVVRHGQRVELEPKAIRVLIYLIEHRERAVSKEELMESVWKNTAVTDNSLTRIVAQIRRELRDDAHQPRYIQTLPTMGYRFIADVEIEEHRVPPPRRRRAWLIAVGMGAAGLALAGWWFRMRYGPSRNHPALRVVQLTTSQGLDIGARFNPDGAAFVYSSNRSGRFEVYRRAVVSDRPEIPVTNDGKQNLQPTWSPDGAWVAYHSVVEHGIWVVPAAGGTPRRLTGFGSSPAWSPNGQLIAFCSSEPHAFTWMAGTAVGASTIWVVAPDGSQLRRVTTAGTPPGPHGAPDWSPDSARIVFGGGSSIWSVDPGSKKLDLLVKADRDLSLPSGQYARLADPRCDMTGEGLYFSAATQTGDYAIYRLRRPGARPVPIHVTGRELPSGLAVARDGKRLLFTRMSHISRLEMVRPGAEPKALFEDAVVRVSVPSFSPDGKHLTFAVEVTGRNREQWIMTAEGRGAARVSADPGPQGSGVTWNRQGQLLYRYSDGSRMEFRRYDPVRKTSEVVCSRPAPGSVFYPLLMPNEQELLSTCSTPPNICLTALDGGTPRQLTFEREGATFPFVSHDGEWIVYNARRGDTVQIAITDRDGAHQEILTNDPGLNWGTSFSDDKRRIAYAAYRDGIWNIWEIDRITRGRRQLTYYTAYGAVVRSPTWRPRSDEVVYEHSMATGNVFLLNLP